MRRKCSPRCAKPSPASCTAEDYEKLGFRCQVHGAPTYDLDTVDRRVRRFMGDGAAWNYVAMQQAIADSGLEEKDVKNERTGIIMGSGGPSTRTIVHAADTTREKGPEARRPLRRAGRHVVAPTRRRSPRPSGSRA